MNLYCAPLEAVTTYIFRSVHHELYGGIDKYFIPFIEPHEKRDFNARELKEMDPAHNAGIPVVPQILTRNAEDFLRLASSMRELGYTEINLNLGCPSATVTSKGRGSGFLAYPEELDVFLDTIYSRADYPISVKTRIGRDHPDEFPALLEIYNKYPISELIIHPRTREEFYGKTIHREMIRYALEHSDLPICYNGDICTVEDYQMLQAEFPQLKSCMIGRGLIANPQLSAQIQDSSSFDPHRFRAFHDRIYSDYQPISSGDQPLLNKMKELWTYWGRNYTKQEKLLKQIKKAKHKREYEQAVRMLFQAEGIE